MEDALENLNLHDEEEEAFQEDEGVVGRVNQLSLVGRCLTNSVFHFLSLRNTLADLWHPIGGICITEIREKRYLFQFFHEVDIDRVVAGIPWFFNNHLLILQKVPAGGNPAVMELNYMEFWIQVHDLPPGLMSASMANQFGDFCSKFIEYDTSILTLGIHHYMRIRVCLNVATPLKRKKKVLVGKSMVVYARFKYEKLSLFCFICGKLGHGESYCPIRLSIDSTKIIFGWDLSLRTMVRHQKMTVSRWLRVADRSPYSEDKSTDVMYGNQSNVGKDGSRNLRGSGGNLNSILIPLGPVLTQGGGRIVKGHDGCIDTLNANRLVYGEMDLDLEEENKSIELSDEKKATENSGKFTCSDGG
ncbi:hypothetical protein Golob_028086 [Gossypium lobatum]|uniref:CCHC-type domain-containing protein n=1 Tax=Gossypium lobatum TaxID=34289 RepID=A0A7J8NJN3_9ROSI|nr:hypothetical protein [Gossypium lobatum]